ncbi:hypothetical protein [Kribbella sp. CA-293567]|uniref:hypothetical protein n=1 Tax=Kribbella sp. CA-293567 TaxID=3002436 RepID=UPI0022DE943E|nr:hypothetical protein [Kribbella sp. CA-293567]WBQ05975.1 hypothetical protein OX958_04035 [Kribbella sp. CA-293567]
MTRSPAFRRLLTALAIALPLAAIWLMFDNPTIDNTSRAATYTCLAPYDTVLNDANNYPGGEPPPDSEDIAHRCRQAGQTRFNLAAGTAAAAIPIGIAMLAVRRRRPSI